MLEQGITKPLPSVAVATRQLVERLSAIPPDERIRIEYTTEPFLGRYIRDSSNDLLAEIRQVEDA